MPEYTTCVLPQDYEDPPLPDEGSFPATMEALFASLALLEDTCEYMLHGKLVCLGGDRCVIGHVVGFETVEDKSFPDNIDNDFSINVLPSPWGLELFTYHDIKEGYELVANDTTPGSQGFLIKEQPNMPLPREAEFGEWHSPRYAGTFVTYPDKTWIDYDSPEWLKGVPYSVPALHCEIEGERAHLVCETLDKLSHPLPGMKEFCEANWFTGLICKFFTWLMTPAIVPWLTAAWAAGADDNRDFMGASSLGRGDLVAIGGRWVYDAGHGGQNELHPVKTVQKLPEDSAVSPDDFDRWCHRIGEAPSPLTGTHADPQTPEQQEVEDEQKQPWSRWVFHPLIDGCEHEDEEEEPPIIK